MSPLSIEVMEFFERNKDTEFCLSKLAKTFGVLQKDIQAQLETLPIKMTTKGKHRFYWLESEEARARIAKSAPIAQKAERPKRDNRAMLIAMERCKELYPNGGNFKSIS